MSKADEMFKELGYIEKFKNHCEDEMYRKDSSHKLGKTIKFRSYEKSIEIYPCKIDIKELQAINEKVKELRMEQLDRKVNRREEDKNERKM